MPGGAGDVKHGKLGRMSNIIAFAMQGVTAPIPDPVIDPTAFYAQLVATWHACWPLALMLALYAALELLVKFVPSLSKLDEGRITLVVSGAIGVLASILNVALAGGQLSVALIAGFGTLLTLWHPQATAVAAKQLGVPVVELAQARIVRDKQSGRAQLSLLLAFVLISSTPTMMLMSCVSGSGSSPTVGSVAASAGSALIDCAAKEDGLAAAKDIAIGLAPLVFGGSVATASVESTAIAAGEKIGGCLLVDLGDEIERLATPSSGMRPHLASHTNASLQRFRAALGSKAKFRDANGIER